MYNVREIKVQIADKVTGYCHGSTCDSCSPLVSVFRPVEKDMDEDVLQTLFFQNSLTHLSLPLELNRVESVIFAGEARNLIIIIIIM